MQDTPDMQDIKESRKKINQIDEQMAALFKKRMDVCKDIALYKKESGLSVRDEVREAEVVKRNSEKSKISNCNPITPTSSRESSTCRANISPRSCAR